MAPVVVSPVLPLLNERERYTWVVHVAGAVLFFEVDVNGDVYRRTFRGRRA